MGDILKKAQTLWNKRVKRGENPLICSFEGFYQHYGECANDSIQMLLCFCDHIKEVVQPTLLFSDEADFMRLIAEHVKTRLSERKLLTYLKAFQNRFARHYLNLSAMCDAPPGFVGPYRAKGRNAIGSALTILHDPATVTEENYVKLEKYGLKWIESTTLFTTLLQVFSILPIIEPLTAVDIYPSIPHAIWTPNTVGYRVRIYDLSPGSSGHAMSYYKCGGQDYIYEDNKGPFPFAWSQYMEFIHKHIKAGNKVDLFHNELWIKDIGTKKFKTIPYYPMFSMEPGIKFEEKIFYTFIPGTTKLIDLQYDSELEMFYKYNDTIKYYVEADEYSPEDNNQVYKMQPITVISSDTNIQPIPLPPFMRSTHNISTLHEVLPSYHVGRNKTAKQSTKKNNQEGGRRKSKKQTRRIK